MKITRRQLRRIIREEKRKLHEARKTIEYQSDEWHNAWDELNEGLVNLVAAALDAGLLKDDLDDAWSSTQDYVDIVMGGY